MSVSASQPACSSVRLWCIAASHAPIVAVIARLYGPDRWTCILRWKWQEGCVEEGAWTTMAIAAYRCRLSPDGEFLLYHATGMPGGFFPGFLSGAFAISRLPWLSALTDPTMFGASGSCASRDGLSPRDQAKLWKLFGAQLTAPGGELWPAQLGHGWRVATSDELAHFGAAPGVACLGASREVPGTECRMYAAVRPVRDKHGDQHSSVWTDEMAYWLVPPDSDRSPPQRIDGVRWVHPAGDGRLLAATSLAKLRVLRLGRVSGLVAQPTIEQEHDVSTLVPRPGTAPAWAKAALARAAASRTSANRASYLEPSSPPT